MKKIILITISLLTVLNACQKKNQIKSDIEIQVKEISFITPDNIKIFGDLYAKDKTSPVIILFHQGGSNARSEYAPIIPKLIKKGYTILAIDQRVGGQYYGGYNRTLANVPTYIYGDGYGYCDAYNNLEGALDFMIESGFTGNKTIWGSSYSASLAIILANNRQNDISGVLAFSPASGGSMKDCLPNQYFETLKKPLLMLRPPSEAKSDNSKAQLKLVQSFGHQTFVAKHGVHGSSMLVEERVKNEVGETWKVVFDFLNKINQ